MQGSPQFWELRFLEDFYPPSQRPGYGLNLSWSRRRPSQQTTLPLRPEKKSGGQAGRLGHILLPGRGWGEWWFAWWTMPTSSLLSFTFLLHLSQSLHTHSWSVPVTSSVSGLVVCRNYTFLSCLHCLRWSEIVCLLSDQMQTYFKETSLPERFY